MRYGEPARGRAGRGRPSPSRGRAARSRGRQPAKGHHGWLSRAWHAFRAKTALAQLGYSFVAVSGVVIVTVGAVGVGWYEHLVGSISSFSAGGLTGRTIYGDLNILVLGSQERQGQVGFFGNEQNPWTTNSDNLLLVHLDATHTHATVLSIPRDLMTYEPACEARIPQIGIGMQGPYDYPPGSIIDGALNIGGPTCAVETVEALTGVKLDHVIELDFNSFRTMVDAVGGVPVCVPKGGYHDPKSHINLGPGIHLVKWDEALAYVRTRDTLQGADAGGDLPRIQLQQAFISSLVQKVQSQGLLNNFSELLRLATTAAKAVAVDKGLASVTDLIGLAKSLVHLHSRDLNLLTLPTTTDTFDNPTYNQRLMTVQPQDDVLFQMLRTGQAWHGALPVEPRNKVRVIVENATGQTGLAKRTAATLTKLGFDVIHYGDAPYTTGTVVQYKGMINADSAYTLMRALKQFPAGEDMLESPASRVGVPAPVTLILGTNFAGVTPAKAPVKPTKPAKSAKKGKHKTSPPVIAASSNTGPGEVGYRNGAANICQGLPLG
jgi:LCP family protein required for cell wall assembly